MYGINNVALSVLIPAEAILRDPDPETREPELGPIKETFDEIRRLFAQPEMLATLPWFYAVAAQIFFSQTQSMIEDVLDAEMKSDNMERSLTVYVVRRSLTRAVHGAERDEELPDQLLWEDAKAIADKARDLGMTEVNSDSMLKFLVKPETCEQASHLLRE